MFQNEKGKVVMKDLDSVLQNISPIYHQDFLHLSKSFQEFEEINFACNISNFEHNIISVGESHYLRIGYLVCTSYRLIWQFYESYRHPGMGLGILDTLSGYKNAQRPRLEVGFSEHKSSVLYYYVIDTPTFPLTNTEKQLTGTQEITLASILGINKYDFKVKNSNRMILKESIETSPDRKTFYFAFPKYDDGVKVYNLIQKYLSSPQNKEVSESVDIVERLAKLADLRKQDLITDDEYEKAKKKLLN
jgi:hypothetical protein